MDVCMDSKDAVPIGSPEEMWGRFQAEVMTQLPDWRRRLEHEPAGLQEIEDDVQRACQRGGAMLVAGLLAQGLEPFEAAALAAHLHGRAGDLAAEQRSQVALIATDLLDFLPAAIQEHGR